MLVADPFRVAADGSGRGLEDGTTTSTVDKEAEKTEVDRLMEGLSFGQLCDEFECISSPAVEKTARQLVKDIMDLREGRRSLSSFGVNVKYKVRVFYHCSLHVVRFQLTNRSCFCVYSHANFG